MITNVELEHHEKWSGGLPQLLAAFAEFAQPASTTVVWSGQPELDRLAQPGAVVHFGTEGSAEFAAADVVTPVDPAVGSSFNLVMPDQRISVQLGVRGEHNVLNALAALASVAANGDDVVTAAKSLATFSGVNRRFQYIGVSAQGASVYDDYAHHPTEIRAALATARQSAQGGRVVVICQPHLFSRVAIMGREMAHELADADVVIVTDVYPAREKAEDFPGITGYLIATQVADAKQGKRVFWSPTLQDVRATLARELRAGDLAITIGAGSVSRVAHELVERAGEDRA